MKNVAHNTRMVTYLNFYILDNNTTLIPIKTTSGAVVFYADSETPKFISENLKLRTLSDPPIPLPNVQWKTFHRQMNQKPGKNHVGLNKYLYPLSSVFKNNWSKSLRDK